MIKNLIVEGGVGGHLNHLYDNRDMTFNELKRILSAASSGTIEGTEKVDGFNVYLGYHKGQPRAARNKGDMKKGGMTLQDLANREFKGGDKIKKVYLNAFKAFSNVLREMTPLELQRIFGKSGEIFYNTEIVSPESSQLITYDRKIVSIHHEGHKKYNPETGDVEFVDAETVAGAAKVLDLALERTVQDETGASYAVKRTAIRKLQALETDSDLKIALEKMRKAGFDGNMTVNEFLYNQISQNSEISNLDGGLKDDIVGRILKNPDYVSLTGIYKKYNLDPVLKQHVRDFVKREKLHISAAVFPLEDAIHDFSVEMLRGLESAYILDNNKEIERLRNELSTAINAIQGYSGPGEDEAKSILLKQMSKLKHHDRIDTAVEGFVFKYKGGLYKFTGNFAPINQILGLFKYGRGNVKPIATENEEIVNNNNNLEDTRVQSEDLETKNPDDGLTFVVLPGAYKPPHAGHYEMAEWYANLPDVDFVYVLISPKSRFGHASDLQIQVTAEQSLEIWNIYRRTSKIIPQIAESESPVKSAYDFMEFLDPGDRLIFGKCEKDAQDTRFDRAQEYSDKNELGIEVVCMNAPELGEGISGTQMRELVATSNYGLFVQSLPKHLDDIEKNRIWDLVSHNHEALEEKKTIMEQFSSDRDFLSVMQAIIEEEMAEAYRGGGKRSGKHTKEGDLVPTDLNAEEFLDINALSWKADKYGLTPKEIVDLEFFRSEEDELEEISAQGSVSGGIEGGGAYRPGKKEFSKIPHGKKKKKRKSIIREDDEELVETVIRHLIKTKGINYAN